MRKFNGGATEYLDNYLVLFQAISDPIFISGVAKIHAFPTYTQLREMRMELS